MDLKQNFTNLYEKYGHFKLFLLFIPTTYIFYFLQVYIEPKYMMYIKLDDYIPFIKYFIIPYVYWYVYLLWGYIYFAFYSKEEFTKFIKFIIYGALAAYVIFFIFPNGQELRNTITPDDIFLQTIYNIRSVDPPANVFPSLHCYNSIGINIAICTSTAFKNKKWVKNIAYISTILISMSTVCIKQHSILDVFGAMILSAIMYIVIYKPSLRRKVDQDQDMITEQ
ncbi:phosphatase PAP2 family protein [Oceanirhabdus sp. W0125-5]|uniref:phosphatase PAP2 family protein n=1 Tax=Oceanirhabdus sp. W0125-5 TaxID=2999116 RepID=UPI0022F2E489|nr:phosphatase PAP2 family protein [Oceanirhabdus sp. W0125-5]WBW95714.1 phosphatase PAP2 family protein [Oceanirhabdus sp. W0125-5]